MNQGNQEKPSPILMLAPIAFVLLGYHYLFHSKLNEDVTASRVREAELRAKTHDVQHEQTSVLRQLGVAKEELETAERETALASKDLTVAVAQKEELRSLIVGQSGDAGSEQPTTNASPSMPSSGLATSTFSQGASMLTSSVSTLTNNDDSTTQMAGLGKCSRMSALCAILDTHRLRRLANSEPQSGSRGLINAERTKLGTLLGMKLPPISRYELQLEGSFPDLIAALHDLRQRLPAVSVLSVSLDPIDVETRTQSWKLEVGIRG